MATVVSKCSSCGADIKLRADGVFAEAQLAAPLCPACTDCCFLEDGGAVLKLRHDLPGARFSLGKIRITRGAVAALADAGEHAATFLARHVRGDWGSFGQCDEIELTADERRRGWEATDDTAKINKSNLLNGRDNIMSEYITGRGEQIWIFTELERAVGTTVLLPEER